ncbi:MAG: ABC transporter substrate-binding protein [Limnochordia bacterium]
MWRWWRRSASMLVVSCLLMLGASSVQAAKVKITWMTTMWKVNEPLHLQIIDEFNGSQDRIEVTMEPIASNDAEAETILLRIAAGTPPDMVDFHPRYFYPFVRNGVLVDIEPFLKEDKRFGLDDFFPAVLESMRVGGTLYGLPQRISVYHLYYNIDQFDGAGVAVPSPSWSDARWNWEAYRQAAGKLTKDADGDGVYERVGASIGGIVEQLLPWIWQGGASLFDRDYQTLTLDSAEGIGTLDYLAEGLRAGVFRQEGWQGFQAGNAAMHLNIPTVMTTYLQTTIFRWDLAALPRGSAGAATVIQPIPYGLVANSKHLPEAAEFFRFFFSRDISRRQSENGIVMQPRRSVTASSAFMPNPPPHNKISLLEALEYARPVPSHNLKFPDITSVIVRTLSQVWTGKADSRTAVASMKQQVNALLAEGR